MKYLFLLCITMSCAVSEVQTKESEHQAVVDQTVVRLLAKYSTVFRLIPTRSSQMLKVVNAYPASDVARRTDLLQMVIQRHHDMYRIMDQLQSRVLELKEQSVGVGLASVCAQCDALMQALKKYQINLISTLSVLDSEFVRSLKRARSEQVAPTAADDSAYLAAKAVLKTNQMDLLINSLAAGHSGIGGEQSDNSVRSEIRGLRDQVALLSAQLQSKALLEADKVSDEKYFSQQINELDKQNGHAVSAAQATLTTIKQVTMPEVIKKKYSDRKEMRAETLKKKVATDYFQAIWRWIVDAIASIGATLNEIELVSRTKSFISALFSDACKAFSHVGARMKEVKDVAPEGVSVAAHGAWTFGSWVVESWARIGNYTLELLQPVKEQIIAWKIMLWDGSVVYDKELEEDVVIPGKIKMWYRDASLQVSAKAATIHVLAKEQAASYSALALEKITHAYRVMLDFGVKVKNRYFPPLTPVAPQK